MNKAKLEAVKELVAIYRGVILDTIEIPWGNAPEWSMVRSRILRAFGDRGLEGRLLAILEKKDLSE